MDGKVMPLSLAKNLEELNTQAGLKTETLSKAKPQQVAMTADKLLSEGDLCYRIERNEERAYVFYMRYIQAVTILKDNIKKDPSLKVLVKPQSVKLAVSRCEELSKSLKTRYDLLQEAKQRDKDIKDKEYAEAAENEKRRKEVKIPKTAALNGMIQKSQGTVEEAHDMTPVQLKNLIEQKSTRFLLVDCRYSSDYTSSHPMHPNCISVPSEILVRGSSAQKISDQLKSTNLDSYLLWSTRGDFEFIILYDWNSSFGTRDHGSPITVLYDAITKWDPSTKYKGKTCFLQGGMRHLYYTYPTLLTNPGNISDETIAPKPDKSSSSQLDSISYPSMDENGAKGPERKSPSPIPKLLINSRIGNMIGKDSNGSVPASTTSLSPVGIDVDRSSKPVRKPATPSINIRPEVTNNGQIEPPGESQVLPSEDPADIRTNGFPPKTINLPPKTINVVPPKSINVPPKTINVPSPKSNGTTNGYGYHSNGVGDSPDSDSGDNGKENPAVSGLSKSLDSTTLAPMRPTVPKPSPNSTVHPSSTSVSSGRPSSQDVSSTGTFTVKLKNEGSEPRSGGLLKRSHSHPNLAQQSFESEDMEGVAPSKTPSFSRNLKPSAFRPQASETYGARRREFQVVSSTEWQRTGLKNLGNTCYMNSIMQCLNHTSHLVEYFRQEAYKDDCRGSGPTRGEATEEVAAAIKEMNFGHRSIALKDLKAVIGRFRESFRGTDQQDSHEFLTILLDWMHEELNRVKVKVPFKEQKNDGLSDDEAGRIAWTDYLSSNDSKISQLFCGEQKSVVRCLTCNKESVKFETFFVLSVPLPSPSKKCTISQCVDLYTSEEEVPDWKCVHCKRSGNAKKKIDLWRLPPYLIIHLQRFYNDGWWKKRLTEVEFPVDRLDLTGKVKGLRNGESRSGGNFQLYGVSNHYGTMDGGHYTAYCRKQANWFKYDDHEVSNLSPRDVCTSAAYILFYQNQS